MANDADKSARRNASLSAGVRAADGAANAVAGVYASGGGSDNTDFRAHASTDGHAVYAATATGDADAQSSTSLAIARRLAPLTAFVCMVCSVAGLVALVASAWWLATRTGTPIRWGLWVLDLVVWGMLVASNARYWVTHSKLAVGMIPPVIMSLAPSMASALYFIRFDMPLWLRWVCWLLLIAALLFMALFAAYFLQVRITYARRDSVEPDATVIVLGGTVRNGRPCKTLLLRLDEAVRMWQTSPRHMFIVTGGPVRGDSRSLCEADYMAQTLAAAGVPRDHVLLERRARNTAENMEFTLKILEQQGIRTQLVVLTSDYHLHRALREGRRLGLELVPVASPTPPNSRLQQWSQEVLALLAKVFRQPRAR
ncbi:MAG: YdcF family protein [Atopobiaceae bacterium]|nr:YdcF family protein [Atopobiaceae bacterium]